MKILQSPLELYREVLDIREVKAGAYKPSVFNYYMEYAGRDIVYNTLRHEIAELTEAERSILNSECIEISGSDCDEITVGLVHDRFLVPIEENETQTYMEFYDLCRARARKPKGKNFFKIFTTLECNARCFYCFEPDHSRKPMTPETVDAVYDYIIKTKTDDKIALYWFGGEPLCNINAIDHLCTRLEETGVEFVSSIVTNGLLLNRQMTAHAKEKWHLKTAQITLDGMREEHNKRKRFITDCSDPFAKIIDNIHGILDQEIRVSIRLNVDSRNLDNVWQLVEYLIKEFEGNRFLGIYPAMIFEEFFKWKSGEEDTSRKALRAQWVKMRDRLEEAHVMKTNAISRELRMSHCMSNGDSSAIINYDGKLFTCQNCQEEMSYGDIWRGNTKPEMYAQWTDNSRVRKKCIDCCFLP